MTRVTDSGIGVWRDRLAFTWEYRTFNFREAILKAAQDVLPANKASNFKFLAPTPSIASPYPGFTKLQVVVSFETPLVTASAVIQAVYTQQGWKIYICNTVIESLKGFPEVQPYDGHMEGAVSWEEQRQIDIDSVNPEILIVGGGQK